MDIVKNFCQILFLLLFSVQLLNSQEPDSVKYEFASPEDFLTMIRFKENAVLIDVRMPFEYRRERIENAINIPVTKDYIKKTGNFDKESVLLLYCTTDVRSSRAAEKLYELGFRKIFCLQGGIMAWKRTGLLTKGRKVKEDVM